MSKIVNTFSKSSLFNGLAYVKFTSKEDIVDFVNIDWQSFDVNETTVDFIEVEIDQKLNSRNLEIYLHKGKSENGDELILLNTDSYRYNKIGQSPLLQLGDDLYYIPYLHFKKMLEASLINIDQLPDDELKRLYMKQIEHYAQNIVDQKELSFDIKACIVDNDFWYQDKNNFTKFVFGRFYTNKILSIFDNRNINRYLNLNYNLKYPFEIFDSYFTDEMTKNEFKNLAYLQGYNGSVQPYNYIYNNHDKAHIAEDSIENRIRAHLLNEVFDGSPYYYDFEGDKHLYEFSTNEMGTMKYKRVSSSPYELSDIVACL